MSNTTYTRLSSFLPLQKNKPKRKMVEYGYLSRTVSDYTVVRACVLMMIDELVSFPSLPLPSHRVDNMHACANSEMKMEWNGMEW